MWRLTEILPSEILNLPKYGCINVHASLLPKLRGASPIQMSIVTGEKETGVTIMQMAEGLDTGDILSSEAMEIGELNAEQLSDARLRREQLTGGGNLRRFYRRGLFSGNPGAVSHRFPEAFLELQRLSLKQTDGKSKKEPDKDVKEKQEQKDSENSPS